MCISSPRPSRWPRQADAVVLCLGGNLSTSKESFRAEGMGDRADLSLLGGQRALFDAVRAACPDKPLVVILVHGGPVADEHLFTHAPAILPHRRHHRQARLPHR
ncbi:MAG: glycoside hydrolase family 3 C-terminal domain-containing protein, partial [Planctomycetota bacterium]